MALEVFSDVVAVLWQHPVLSGLVLVLFTPPFFPIVKFFSPLLISTALFMIALFTMGGQAQSSAGSATVEENWEFRRAADVKVWEDNSVSTSRSRRRVGEGSSWMNSLQAIAEALSSWVETKLQSNENWKGSSLNDDNVSILHEASWPKEEEDDVDASPPLPVTNSRTEEGLGEDEAPPKQSTVRHVPLVALEIPNKTVTADSASIKPVIVDSSPSVVDMGESSMRMVRKDSINASSGLSELDTPVAALSTSEKLNQIEKLGGLIEKKEQHQSESKPVVLKETIADRVEAVKEKLEDFTHSPPRPSSPLFKPEAAAVTVKSRKSSATATGYESSSSGDEQLSDSESDSEFEIFPPVDPAKIKLHPPVKLDIPQLEKKLGMSLSQRTSRASTPPKGEITEAL